MITQVDFQNFKIFKNVTFKPNRINIFIGPPNSGKTCLIEGLSFFISLNPDFRESLKDLIQFNSYHDLFNNKNIKNKLSLTIRYTGKKHQNSEFVCNINSKNIGNNVDIIYTIGDGSPSSSKSFRIFQITNKNEIISLYRSISEKYNLKICPIKFKKIQKFSRYYIAGLNLPYGDNLIEFLDNNHEFLDYIAAVLDSFGLKLRIDEEDYLLKYELKRDDLYIRAFNYWLLPDTVQRFILYALAVQYFKDSIILLEEPESQLFPIYIRKLAELIARNNSNQYFITTHNPYFISIILDNVAIKDVNIYWMEYDKEKGISVMKNLTEDEIKEIKDLDYDIFYKYN